jgi:hypothetical protein
MARGKVKGKVKASVKKKPVKAGSTPQPHGGFPTQKVITIRSKVIADIKKKDAE